MEHRYRNRTEDCPYCGHKREIEVNLDTQQPVRALIPTAPHCTRGWKCIEEMRDKALLAPFADGKTRLR